MMKPLTITLGLGGIAFWLLTKKAAIAADPGELVETNGHKWLLRILPNPPGSVGAVTTNVFAPAGSWGPHSEMLVLRFSTPIVPGSPRILSGVGTDVPVQMRDAAMADLGVKVPGT